MDLVNTDLGNAGLDTIYYPYFYYKAARHDGAAVQGGGYGRKNTAPRSQT